MRIFSLQTKRVLKFDITLRFERISYMPLKSTFRSSISKSKHKFEQSRKKKTLQRKIIQNICNGQSIKSKVRWIKTRPHSDRPAIRVGVPCIRPFWPKPTWKQGNGRGKERKKGGGREREPNKDTNGGHRRALGGLPKPLPLPSQDYG